MVLVTGGTGLVGSHLLYQLTNTHDNIIAIYRSKEKIEKVQKVFSFYTDDVNSCYKKIKWIQADIIDVSSLEVVFSDEITQVYHCAALISFNPKDYHKMRKVNIEGTANIVNFCVTYKVVKLCYVSSIATLGNTVKNNSISEDTERNESFEESDYAITKYGAEMEVWRASQEGVAVIIVNPGVILGSGFFTKGSGEIFTKIYNGLPFYTEGITGFVSVKDVVKTMLLLTASNIKNERFILVSENSSFKEVFILIAKYFQKKPPMIKVHPFIINLAWRIDWLLTKITRKKPFLTKNTARASLAKNYYSSKKIKEQLQHTFEPLEESIKHICTNFSS